MLRAPAMIVCLLLLASAVVAAPLDPARNWARIGLDEAAQQPQPATMPAPMSPDTPYISRAELSALGDIDGDGRAEVLYFSESSGPDAPPAEAQALSAADFTKALWTLKEPEDQFLHGLDDVNGDGVNDLMAGAFRFEFGVRDLRPMPVAGVWAYEFTNELRSDVSLWSGRDAATMGSFSDGFAGVGTSAGASSQGAGASGRQGTDGSSSWSFYPGGYVFFATSTSTSVYASVATPVEGTGTGTSDWDGTFSLGEVSGATLAEFEVKGPEREPMTGTLLPRAGDAPLLTALWSEAAPVPFLDVPAPVVAPSRLHITSLDGSAVAWEVVTDPAMFLDVELIPLPDINGDGTSELQTLEIVFDASAPNMFTAATVIRNGATGATITRIPGSDAVTAYLPFGDLEGDGKPELLWATVPLDEEGEVAFGVASSDLTVLWEATTAGFPVNYVPGGDGEMGGLVDWTGDGAPDVALEDDGGIVLLDGKTGTTVWERAITEDEQSYLIGESTGTGSGDLVVTRVTGIVQRDGPDDGANAVAVIEVIAGETGEVVRRQVMRDPQIIAAGAAGARLSAANAGDVDGDGRDEFSVRVYDVEIFEEVEDGETRRYTRSLPTSYLFSLAKEAPLLVVGNRLATDEATAALPPPEGATGSDGDGGKKESPAAPLWLLLAALAAIVVVVRRSRP